MMEAVVILGSYLGRFNTDGFMTVVKWFEASCAWHFEFPVYL